MFPVQCCHILLRTITFSCLEINQHHNIMLFAQISLTLSLAIHLYYPLLPAGSLDYILCLYRADVDKVLVDCPTLTCLCERVHRKMLLMSLFLLLQQCPTYLVRLIWMVLEMGGRWLFCCCFVGCCFQDLFNIACRILVQFLSSFFSMHLVSVHVVHPCSRTDMTAAWKKSAFYFIG